MLRETQNITCKLALDNGNWWKFFLKHHKLIRLNIIINVLKLLVCRTSFLGYHYNVCPNCKKGIKVPHTCKSRFCSSCGKKATDNWIKTSFNTSPDTKWQHITFTMPDQFWCFFWYNRHLIGIIPSIAACIIKNQAKGIIPGIFLAIHTFGRDLKRNVHIHLSTNIGGLTLDKKHWEKNCYFNHQKLKDMWRYRIITLLRNQFKCGKLKLPPHLKHIYNKTWIVYLSKHSDNKKNNVEYLGKYVKRPPLGETRIKSYDGKNVIFEYLEHYSNTTQTMTLPVLDFIARLICHIHDKHFRVIRYYGFLSNRLRGTLLPIVYTLLRMKTMLNKKVYIPWRNMIKLTFKSATLKCSSCNKQMIFSYFIFPRAGPIIEKHEEIANGEFPLMQ